MKDKWIHAVAGGVLAGVLAATAADAQAPAAAQQGPTAPQQGPTAPQLTPGRLDQMLAPIALYPDNLLGEILTAATYPLDVVEAARWVQDPRNASLKGNQLLAALQQQNWDPSVKSLAPFPSILRMMDANLEWTERLGEAFLADPRAVMDAVQRLRRRAQSAGRLVSAPQEIVRTVEEEITIETPSPEIVYVPVCDPSVVYGAWPYPAYPPDSFEAFFNGVSVGGFGCGWVSWPIVAPLWGLVALNFRDHHIHISRDRFALLDKTRRPIGGEEWRHDPSHRGNVPYRDPEVAARYGGAAPSREILSAFRAYPTGSLPRIHGPVARPPTESDQVPPLEGVDPDRGGLAPGALEGVDPDRGGLAPGALEGVDPDRGGLAPRAIVGQGGYSSRMSARAWSPRGGARAGGGMRARPSSGGGMRARPSSGGGMRGPRR